VKAEFASLVAFASEMVVHGNAVDGVLGLAQVARFTIDPKRKCKQCRDDEAEGRIEEVNV